uniref:Putative thimet oligopeptidase isoform X2 n=1 Tax=Rhizophora mucronata TaxID=61149 RepID=A0A2P2KF85_RHIMU
MQQTKKLACYQQLRVHSKEQQIQRIIPYSAPARLQHDDFSS